MPSKTKEQSIEETMKALEAAKAALEAAQAQVEAAESSPEPVQVKDATVVHEKKVPTTGQSAPPAEFPLAALNDKEKSILDTLDGDGVGARTTLSLSALGMECFGGEAETEAQAYSWARNSVRRLVRGSWVEKPARGLYRITAKGRKRLKEAEDEQ